MNNRANIAGPLALAIERWSEQYDSQDSDLTASQIPDLPQKVAIIRARRNDIERDVLDRMWAAIGTGFHDFIHKYAQECPSVIAAEQRVFTEIEGWKISGQFDLLEQIAGVVTLVDYKLITLWGYLRGPKADHVAQLNIYRWLLHRSGEYPPVEALKVCAVWRDWSASAAEPSPTGPATGSTMSAPSSKRFCAKVRPSSRDSKLLVNRPARDSGFQPRTRTFLPFSLL